MNTKVLTEAVKYQTTKHTSAGAVTWRCQCAGFTVHGTCKHIAELQKVMR